MFNTTPTGSHSADLSMIASLNNNPVYNQHDIRTSPRLRAAGEASKKCRRSKEEKSTESRPGESLLLDDNVPRGKCAHAVCLLNTLKGEEET